MRNKSNDKGLQKEGQKDILKQRLKRLKVIREQITHKIKEIKKDNYLGHEIKEAQNKVVVGIKYNDPDLALEGIEGLLVNFGFVKYKNVEGHAIRVKNRLRATGLVTGRLNMIQCRPFKNGVALVISIKQEKTANNKIVKKIKFYIEIARKEGDDDSVVLKQLWNGTEDGLHTKKTNKAVSERGAFDRVSVRKW